MILREFNMEQLIRIVQKAIIKNNAMFESNFDALRSNSMKGYPAGLQSFIDDIKRDRSQVDLSMLIYQNPRTISFGVLSRVLCHMEQG